MNYCKSRLFDSKYLNVVDPVLVALARVSLVLVVAITVAVAFVSMAWFGAVGVLLWKIKKVRAIIKRRQLAVRIN